VDGAAKPQNFANRIFILEVETRECKRAFLVRVAGVDSNTNDGKIFRAETLRPWGLLVQNSNESGIVASVGRCASMIRWSLSARSSPIGPKHKIIIEAGGARRPSQSAKTTAKPVHKARRLQ
jgi:hypothetical protein